MEAFTAYLTVAQSRLSSVQKSQPMLERAPEVIVSQSSQDNTAVVAKMFDRYGVDNLQTSRLTDHITPFQTWTLPGSLKLVNSGS